MPGRRMHHHPGRLVDKYDIAVLVDHIEGDCFGNHVCVRSLRHGNLIGLARFDPMADVTYGLAPVVDLTFADQSLHAGAAKFGVMVCKLGRKPAIEALTRVVQRHLVRNDFGIFDLYWHGQSIRHFMNGLIWETQNVE